jgi:hypothetical protein
MAGIFHWSVQTAARGTKLLPERSSKRARRIAGLVPSVPIRDHERSVRRLNSAQNRFIFHSLHRHHNLPQMPVRFHMLERLADLGKRINLVDRQLQFSRFDRAPDVFPHLVKDLADFLDGVSRRRNPPLRLSKMADYAALIRPQSWHSAIMRRMIACSSGKSTVAVSHRTLSSMR